METKEYIVSLNKDIDYDQFWNEIETTTTGIASIPDRPVSIVNNRDGSLRNCHYALTDAEANILRRDPRVYAVELAMHLRDDIEISPVSTQNANFSKTTSSSGNYVNWGLIRNSNSTNVYGVSTTTPNLYNYVFDGTGVDVVIHDSGLQVDHPEFTDSNNNTRVRQIDWYAASGLPGTQSPNHYRDFHGHGTHVGGIVAGKTYGWAKNADIYSLKVSGLEGSGDSGTGISVYDCFDVVKLWHRNKTNGRPTVVNMSWGYRGTFNVAGGVYRGVSWTGTANPNYGMISSYYNARVSSVDVDLEELIDAGVIVCVAAGNYYAKIDVPGGPDYNNTWTDGSYSYYYHRGSSPYSANAIIVGALDSTVYSGTLDKKAAYSSGGPGVSVYAAGSYVMSSTSNTNVLGGTTRSDGFKQVNISGTSMASPQVAGMSALYLQSHPTATPSQVKEWVLNNSTQTVWANVANVSANDYPTTTSLWGGSANVAYQPLIGATQVKNNGSWEYVANAFVKTSSDTWSTVKSVWTKVDDTTWKQVY